MINNKSLKANFAKLHHQKDTTADCQPYCRGKGGGWLGEWVYLATTVFLNSDAKSSMFAHLGQVKMRSIFHKFKKNRSPTLSYILSSTKGIEYVSYSVTVKNHPLCLLVRLLLRTYSDELGVTLVSSLGLIGDIFSESKVPTGVLYIYGFLRRVIVECLRCPWHTAARHCNPRWSFPL